MNFQDSYLQGALLIFSGGIVVPKPGTSCFSCQYYSCNRMSTVSPLDLHDLGSEFASKCDCCQEERANDFEAVFSSDNLILEFRIFFVLVVYSI